jgi:hypothetical protein
VSGWEIAGWVLGGLLVLALVLALFVRWLFADPSYRANSGYVDRADGPPDG